MALLQTTDTITAIATPPGAGGIGIIRISGTEALSILKRLFTPKYPCATMESHKMYYGTARDLSGNILDEILAVYMRAPATYTREDVVELHCHGSFALLQLIIQEIVACGARPAEPGEFTKRAFLAGRIDLTQAEAVIDLLNAQTEKGITLAANQLQGRLAEALATIRKELINILAVLEVAIDFPDDDVELVDADAMAATLEHQVIEPIEQLLLSGTSGKIIREGVSVVIAGRPNVGKSSLLNALLQEERALVTPIEGTTRDTIEELVSIRGIPVHIVDTAGIRTHNDQVEELGIERAHKKMQAADVVLMMLDASQDLTERDLALLTSIKKKKHVVVLNKKDKAEAAQLELLRRQFDGVPVVALSAKKYDGLEALQDTLYDQIMVQEGMTEVGDCAPNARHLGALEKTVAVCRDALNTLRSGAPCDLLAVEVQSALGFLGDIIGLTTPDDVLDTIFSEFCIGK